MLTVNKRDFSQFLVTTPAPCPYLTDQYERKLFTHLPDKGANVLNDELTANGFRRSHNILYRPMCERCSACIPVRVPVDHFIWSKSFKRTVKMNSDLVVTIAKQPVDFEHYELFHHYVTARHYDGGMADMEQDDFAMMVNMNLVESALISYRQIETNKLLAALLIDLLADGISMIYSFYNPTEKARGLGTFMILNMIEKANLQRLNYLYLGYWIKNSPKMEYKARFLPQERLGPNGWTLYYS